ncbi:peptidase S28 [Xylariaceae sp. FL0804]|nr:peptidase S28 [Xylariaceae sp. FL0804]
MRTILASAALASAFWLLLPGTLGLMPARPLPPKLPARDGQLAELSDAASVATSGVAHFEQYIDHGNPGLGTFNQTYWYNATHYRGPGSPIVVFTPGEEAAEEYTGYLTDETLCGLVAAAVGGAVVLVEHRYWGNSTPFAVQSTENLQYLTLEQSVSDFTRFARAVELPFDPTGSSNAPSAPWVWIGGSYSGALGAWIESLQPGTMWATHSTSGPVQTIYDYWEYYQPIQQGMPQNCSRDFTAIVDHVDAVLGSGSPTAQAELKQMFRLEGLAHNDDAAAAITTVMGYWQSIQFYSGYSTFYEMCDAIEGGVSNSSGVGMPAALDNYAEWFRTEFLPYTCESYGYSDWQGEYNVECFDTYNASSPMYTDWSDDNVYDRTWVWLTCNEPFDYWQAGAPPNVPTLYSRLASAEYFQRQCGLYFPREGPYTYGSAEGRTAAGVDARTKGWFLPEYLTAESRLIWVNGQYDPWRSASVASEFRPGGPYVSNSTAGVPAVLLPGARHCYDLIVENAEVNAGIAAALPVIIDQLAAWTQEFYDQ